MPGPELDSTSQAQEQHRKAPTQRLSEELSGERTGKPPGWALVLQMEPGT
jgi:hypothetical protein